jgi:nucleoside-diphosphate-sugar epimerase
MAGLRGVHDVVEVDGAPILSLEKYAELTAPGWVCRVDRLRDGLGFSCSTTIEEGVERTVAWYRREGWL